MLPDYYDIDSVCALAEAGDICLVKASYLIKLTVANDPLEAEGAELVAELAQGRLLRRQDLPAHAVVDASDLKRWADEVRSWRALMAAYPKDIELQHSMRFPPFVVVSHAWQHEKDPDPLGLQLREVLAPALTWYMAERARLIALGERFDIHHSEAKAEARLNAPATPEGIDFAVFLDFSSVYQAPRDEVQDASFSRAVAAMDVLYAHQETVLMRLTRKIEGYGDEVRRCGAQPPSHPPKPPALPTSSLLTPTLRHPRLPPLRMCVLPQKAALL